MQSNKRIAKNTVFLYFRMIFVLGVSLYTTRIIFNVLGVIDYGIYNVVNGFVMLFTFLNTSLSNGVQRFYNYNLGSRNSYSIKQVFNTSLLIQLSLGLLILIIAEILGLWYFHSYLQIPSERTHAALWVFHTGVFSLFFVIIQIPYNAAIIAYERMDYYALVNIIDILVRLVIVLILPYLDADKMALYGCFVLGVNILDFVLYAAYCKFHFLDFRISFSYSRNLLREMLVFSGWNIFGTFAYVIQSQGLNLLLNGFFGPILNAARGIANMIQGAIQGFQGNIALAFRPQLIQSYASRDMERVTSMFTWLTKASYLMLLAITTPLLLELHQILELWLGEDVPIETYVFTFLILINLLLSSLNTPVTQIIHASGIMKTYQITTGVITCMTLPVSWATLKLGFTPSCVFIICIIVTIINQIACLYILNRIFTIDFIIYIKKTILPLLVVSLLTPVLGFMVTRSMQESFIRLFLVGVISVLSCFVLSFIIALQNNERQIIIKFLKEKIKNDHYKID